MEKACLVVGFLAALIALYGVLCALNACKPGRTPKRISYSFLMISWGWGLTIFAILDVLLFGKTSENVFGSVIFPVGVTLLATGNAVLYLVNRRACTCPDCPDYSGGLHRDVRVMESRYSANSF
jgi:hypothetical protein